MVARREALRDAPFESQGLAFSGIRWITRCALAATDDEVVKQVRAAPNELCVVEVRVHEQRIVGEHTGGPGCETDLKPALASAE